MGSQRGKMKNIKKTKAQSMVEFVIVFPFFLLLVLGLVQLAAIFMNVMALKYTAYMTARVAAVYEKDDVREEKAGRALNMLKAMNSYANSADKNPAGSGISAAKDFGLDFAMNLMNEKTGGEEGTPLEIEKEVFENSKVSQEAGEETRFIKVTVTYRMPLKVPFVNRIFGLLQSDIKIDIWEVLNGNLFKHNKQEWVKYGLNKFAPYYTLKAVSVMRVG